jgi:hypothetical protein
MAVSHSTAAKNAATDAVTALLGSNSELTFRISAAGAIAATLLMTTPTAFGAASGGVATAATITTNTNCAGHASPVTHATLNTSAHTVVITCEVADDSDIDMTGGLTITAGDTVSCSSLTYAALSA